LLRAVAQPAPEATRNAAATDSASAGKPRFIRIAVDRPAAGRGGDNDVNIRVPIAIVRSGMRLGAILPGFVGDKVTARLRDKGLDLDLSKLDPAAFESILTELGEVAIDVDSGDAQVRISCE
jgi:hypothetical protein